MDGLWSVFLLRFCSHRAVFGIEGGRSQATAEDGALETSLECSDEFGCGEWGDGM